ncbi:hypothetical protein COT94_02100 [Candidatus Falkowbacteria bacterium CG10_big_fil_rev_8_21_14_0_10_37_14]|uniref:Uncharacterized protein n=2 Tax=Bacteria candidate phyla TaxID=1783234 RepID=A0A2M6WTI4_9BACT|nr:hypothetical protein [Candidatus Falkowbacteria bacterium]OIN89313.1 MAG: hypothetical protein AUJ40_02125 [Candidatus Berkelbacteria bacterium CG1_02_42_45]PIT96036.1 MAG: hypothetical protein COT94_02100 [Candidatus Falkowbacteria bacterium CG10_big_fil_rev_8_21_14_0_10_37_14]
MFDFIETILIKLFGLLPDADPNNPVLTAVNSAFGVISPTFAKIDLIFPIFVLFKVLLLVLFVEMTLFLFMLVMKVATFFKA